MVIKIQTSPKSNGNKGSSAALVNYLEKEDLELEQKAFASEEIPEERKGFFNHEKDGVKKEEVIDRIDNNKKKFGRNDSKFYSITFSPSEQEQKHILKNITNREISNVNELDKEELKAYEKELQNYTRNSMNEYASNFKKNSLSQGSEILYYGKVEHNRDYKGTSKEVKNGLVKSGDSKPGLNSHVHLIVSRRDREQRYKISPMIENRNYFDRNSFKMKSERVFDKQMQYKRPLDERYEYHVQASKDVEKSIKIELEINQNKKEELQNEIINDFDERNGYTEKDKELTHEIEPSFEKEQAVEQSQKQNNDDYEIEY